jgi:hypothetical protein
VTVANIFVRSVVDHARTQPCIHLSLSRVRGGLIALHFLSFVSSIPSYNWVGWVVDVARQSDDVERIHEYFCQSMSVVFALLPTESKASHIWFNSPLGLGG